MRKGRELLEIYITRKSVEEYIGDVTCSSQYFVRHVFVYLRAHPELWEIADYRRLYDETLEYWANDYDGTEGVRHDPGRLSDFEFLADLFIKYPFEKTEMYTQEQVDQYLNHRRAVWREHSRLV
ncbi:MAG: hypothetical protein IJW62_06220 [Clostridia bacterium]|nr:hypothetical protein [Clostridia bacterium]